MLYLTNVTEYFIATFFMLQMYHQLSVTLSESKKMRRFAVYALCLISLMDLRVTADQQCKPAEASINGKTLKGHTFKTSVVGSLFECQVLCENELKCQSYNYFIPSKICELNDRTKETKPYSFVTDENSVYMKSWPNRGTSITIRVRKEESLIEIAELITDHLSLETIKANVLTKKFITSDSLE